MPKLSRSALRQMAANPGRSEAPVTNHLPPVAATCTSSCRYALPMTTTCTSNCLYAPYLCQLYRAHAPEIWCSHCRVATLSEYSQHGIRINPFVFNPPTHIPICSFPIVQDAPCPLRLLQPHTGYTANCGSTCVTPVSQTNMCPTTIISCPSVVDGSRAPCPNVMRIS